ncbi:MAG: tetratricopeptide repeat protein [Pleurocapsa sp.]
MSNKNFYYLENSNNSSQDNLKLLNSESIKKDSNQEKLNNLIEADYYHRLALSLGQDSNGDPHQIVLEESTNQINHHPQYSLSSSNSQMLATKPQTSNIKVNNSINPTISSSTIVLPKLTAVAPGTYVENNQLEVTKIYLQQAKLYYSDARWHDCFYACDEALIMCSDLPETYMIYGNSLLQMGKMPEALGYYANALAKDPHLAEVYANIGSLYAKQNNLSEAINYYQKALRIDSKQAKICLHLSKAWERIGEDERALDALFQALSVQPEILTVAQYIQLVDDLLADNKIQQAIICCEHGIKIKPPAKPLYLKLIKILEQDCQVEKAASHRQLIANLPENSSQQGAKKLRIQRLLSRAATKYLPPVNSSSEKNSDRSGKLIEQQLQSNVVGYPKLLAHGITEDNITTEQYLAELKKQPDSSTIRLNLGNLFARKQQWREAIVYYQQAIKIEPNLAIAHLRLGKIYGILGKHLEGAELIYRAYSIQPEIGTPEQHYKLGEFWLKQQKGKVAMSCYRRAIQLKPGFQEAYDRLRQLIALQTQQSAKLAEAEVEKPSPPKVAEVSQANQAKEISQDREQEQEHCRQAIAAVKAKNWQLAAQCYQEAIKLNPQQFRYHYNLGEVQVKLDRWKEALECYQKAGELEPNNADIQHNLGEIFSHEGAWENAVDAYKKAIALESKNSWTYHNLGYALLQLQQWQSAAEYFTQAISL